MWNYSVIGIAQGTVLCMNFSEFQEIVAKYPSTAIKFIKILTDIYSKNIFDRKSHNIPSNITASQNFLEIDTTKLTIEPKLNKITEESEDDPGNSSVLPLYTFPMFDITKENLEVHEKKLEKTYQNPEKKEKNEEDKEIPPEELVFPKQKLAKQIIEVNSKRKGRKSIKEKEGGILHST